MMQKKTNKGSILQKELLVLKYVSIFGAIFTLFAVWFLYIDVKFNPVIKFTNGVDPMAFELTKESYAPGEMVKGVTSFCKKRKSSGATQWNLFNSELKTYTKSEYKSMPKGTCLNGIVFDIEKVPDNFEKGHEFYFTANNYQKLWGGRESITTFQTVTATVK